MVSGLVGLLWRSRRKTKEDENCEHDISSHPLPPQAMKSSSKSKPRRKRLSPIQTLLKKRSLRSSSSGEAEVDFKLGCYLCGQQTEKSKLLSHVTECTVAWNRREMIQPEDERVPLPSTPKELQAPLPKTAEEAEAFNKHMRSVWLKAINRRCDYCKNTFKAGAYYKHIKTCRLASEEEKNQKESKVIGEASNKPNLQRKSSKKSLITRSAPKAILERKSNEDKTHSPKTPGSASKSRRHSYSDKACTRGRSDVGKKAEISVEASAGSVNFRRVQSFTGHRPKPCEQASVSTQLKSHLRLGVNEVIQEKKSFKVKALRPTTSLKDSPSNKTPGVVKTESVRRRENDIPLPPSTGQKPDPFRKKQLDDLGKSVEKLKKKQQARSFRESQSCKTDDSASSFTELSNKSAPVTARCSSFSHSHRDREDKLQRRASMSDRSPSKTGHLSDRERTLDKSMSTSFKQPRGYVCYLCGRSFGSASLAIHVPQCRRLWEEREGLKRRKRERRRLPTPPPEIEAPLPTDPDERRAFNDAMLKIWDSKSLNPCPHCGRTFTDEAFEKHQRVCTHQHPGGPLGISKTRRPLTEQSDLVTSKSHEEDRRPLAYCCYLCGRQYGAKSLFLHVPRCRKLWEDREATKPKDKARPVPSPPPELKGFPDVTLPTDPEELLALNNAVFAYWDRVSLYVCSTCGRSFNEESYEKHQRLCASKKVTDGDEKEQEMKMPSMPKTYICYLCGRHYGSKSLKIHQSHCERQWLAEEDLKSKSHRRPLPPRPLELDAVLPSDVEDIAEFNSIMLRHWEQHSLIKCSICDRTFNSEAYEKHRRHCSHIKATH